MYELMHTFKWYQSHNYMYTMVKVQKSKDGRYTLTIPVYIAEAMGLEKGSQVKFRWNGRSWELRKA